MIANILSGCFLSINAGTMQSLWSQLVWLMSSHDGRDEEEEENENPEVEVPSRHLVGMQTSDRTD